MMFYSQSIPEILCAEKLKLELMLFSFKQEMNLLNLQETYLYNHRLMIGKEDILNPLERGFKL